MLIYGSAHDVFEVRALLYVGISTLVLGVIAILLCFTVACDYYIQYLLKAMQRLQLLDAAALKD